MNPYLRRLELRQSPREYLVDKLVAVAKLGIEVNKVFVVVARGVFVEDKLNKKKRILSF
jgi:hypothetical protein